MIAIFYLNSMRLVPAPRLIELKEGACDEALAKVRVIRNPELPDEGFQIDISHDRVRIEVADCAGEYYARQTLNQICDQAGERPVPCLRLSDWPDFTDRGYMLDISRDRVPTMDQLFRLVDLLASLRYNQLQLYTEHTFAYSGHEAVWRKASPITAFEMRELDSYCQKKYIELVPNQNSFGHFERWLCHPEYHHLAECLEGFEHPISGWRKCGSVIRPEQISLDFLDGLYAELLPNFTSKRFNIGGDEPWELGQGASKARVEAEGKSAVYLDFLARVCALSESHEMDPMCWADILLESPESIQYLPNGITPILWGYEADHPFDEQCGMLSALNRPYYIAPGDSTWNSFTGRRSNMEANVDAAIRAGEAHSAAGILLTHWGDGGHPQPFVVALPALVRTGLSAWNREQVDRSFTAGLSLALSRMGAPIELGEMILEAGALDGALNCDLVNRSFLANTMKVDLGELDASEKWPSRSSLRNLIKSCDALIDAVETLGEAHQLVEELSLALRMNRYASYRYLGDLGNCPDTAQCIRENYRLTWLSVSRPGGLEDSLRKLKAVS